MSNLSTTVAKVQPIGVSHGIFGYNTDVSRESPDVQIEILKRIDCAMQNIGGKHNCNVEFVELYGKLGGLKSYILSRNSLPSFKVSILIALCTYIQSISSREIHPSITTEKRRLMETRTTMICTTTGDSSPQEEQKALGTKGIAAPQPKNNDIGNQLIEDASKWPPMKTKKKSVLSRISKKVKKSKAKKEEVTPSSVKKEQVKKNKIVKAAKPSRASKTKNTAPTTLKGKKGIAPARFRQVGAIIDAIASQKKIYEYSVTVLREIDMVIVELRQEEFAKGWLVQFFNQESKLLRFLKPTVDHQWRPILVFMRLVLFPIALPLVRMAFSTIQSWDNQGGYHIATLFLCLLAAPTFFDTRYNKEHSGDFTADMLVLLLLRLMVEYCTSVMFALFTILFFSEVSCKQLASFLIKIWLE